MKKNLYKILYLIIFVNVVCINTCYAKKKTSEEVQEPISHESSIHKTEGTIYAGTNSLYSPINTERPGFVQEEYDKVNNYNVDFETLELRIKYFSPNYNNAKTEVINSSIMNSGMRGKDTTNTTSNTLDSNNGTLVLKMESLIKVIKNEVVSYLAARDRYLRLKEQSELYKKMLTLEEQSLRNGLSTALNFNNASLESENARQQLLASETEMNRLKSSVAKYLGYNIGDVDKLNFIEPEIDITKIASINYDEDLQKMLMSNSNYIGAITKGDEGSNGSSKLPGSTGEDIYNRKMRMAKDNAEITFENEFATLINKCRLYVSNLTYLSKIANLREADNNTKYQSKLISEIDYIRNNINVIKDRADVASSKYELMKAYNDYYYDVLLY